VGMLALVIGGLGQRTGRFWLAGGRLRAGAVLAGLALLGVSAPAAAQTLTWSVVPSPNPAVRTNKLTGVSCASADACMAVGGISLKGQTLIESWDGTSWSRVPSPSPAVGSELTGVSCASATACMAVGDYSVTGGFSTLVESWDGTSWSVVPSPNPGAGGISILSGVSCASATACTAVGYDYTASAVEKTLVESWDGTSWSVVPSPSPGNGDGFGGVSCISADACTAVGSYAPAGASSPITLVESWDGSSWSVVPSPSPSPGYGDNLAGVSCVSATVCTAVGQRSTTAAGVGNTLVESWNGTSWSVVPSPEHGAAPSNLIGVSCVSATACTAAGRYHPAHGGVGTLIESWNGTSWSVVHSPNRGSWSELDGVSCASAIACMAVGFHQPTGTGVFKTLIEAGTASG
jgi:hypothetical protein